MADKLRVGIIGTGLVGKRHIDRYQSMRQDVEIVALADIDLADVQRVGHDNGIPQVFTDYRDLLKIDEIDSVDVCLPNFLHAPVTIAALEAGKHVYCEKPMATTYADARAMYDTARRTGKILAVQMRTLFSKETRTAKYLIQEGALGRTYYAKTSRYLRRARVYVDGYATPHFVQKQKSGGGALIDVGVYQMARMVYLLDNPEIESVTASTFQALDMDEIRHQESGYNVEELGTGFIRFNGGITMFVETAWAVNLDGGDGDCIMGSKGGLRLENRWRSTSIQSRMKPHSSRSRSIPMSMALKLMSASILTLTKDGCDYSGIWQRAATTRSSILFGECWAGLK